MTLNICPEINAISNEIISTRRDFHKYPELSFKEFNTSKIIEKNSNFLVEERTRFYIDQKMYEDLTKNPLLNLKLINKRFINSKSIKGSPSRGPSSRRSRFSKMSIYSVR